MARSHPTTRRRVTVWPSQEPSQLRCSGSHYTHFVRISKFDVIDSLSDRVIPQRPVIILVYVGLPIGSQFLNIMKLPPRKLSSQEANLDSRLLLLQTQFCQDGVYRGLIRPE